MPIHKEERVLDYSVSQIFDLVISNLSLHWLNDFPGTLSQVFRILKPDGLFLASFLGEQTLFELQQSFYQAEIEVEGGVSPRISPFIRLKDAGNLLVRAGFALPVADAEKIIVEEAAWLPLWWGVEAKALVKPWIKDYKFYSMTIPTYQYVWIDKDIY